MSLSIGRSRQVARLASSLGSRRDGHVGNVEEDDPQMGTDRHRCLTSDGQSERQLALPRIASLSLWRDGHAGS